MNAGDTLLELTVVFAAPAIRGYGGDGAHAHADPATAREFGFPDVISWGTLTLQPFAIMLERTFGPQALSAGSLSVRFRRAVVAGDAIRYDARPAEAHASGGAREYVLTATTGDGTVVASGHATIALTGPPRPKE